MSNHTTRRNLVRSMAAIGLAAGLAGCSDDGSSDDGSMDGDGTVTDGDLNDDGTVTPTDTDGQEAGAVAEAAFAASLSDDGSIPGHDDSGSDGTGEASLDGNAEGRLEFEVTWADLEGDVTGIHIHGDGSADGSYLVRLFEPSDSEHADGAVVTGDLQSASGGSVSGTITDEHVNPSGDFDGDVETTAALVAELERPELGESGGVINIHSEHDQDSELAGQVTTR
jgi:hypothetical protein